MKFILSNDGQAPIAMNDLPNDKSSVILTQGDQVIEVLDLVNFILKLQLLETEQTRRAMGGRYRR